MGASSPIAARRVRVASVEKVATDIKLFELKPADGRPLPAYTAGAHVDVHIPNAPIRQYSICSDPRETGRYAIAVKREPDSRGGSAAMHDHVEMGSIMGISIPRNNFPVAAHARRHIFIAGGVGITPILSMIREVSAREADWELHYCARSATHAAFRDELQAFAPSRVFEYFSEEPLFQVASLAREHLHGEHLYCCGPASLMSAVKEATQHWPQDTVHFEWFTNTHANEGPKRAFEVELRRSGLVLQVPADRTILEVLRDAGITVASSCEDGICGTCETAIVEGEADHRDMLLTPQERAANKTMMICVSRARGDRLVLDL